MSGAQQVHFLGEDGETEEGAEDGMVPQQTSLDLDSEQHLAELSYLLSLEGYVGAVRLKDGLFLGDHLAAVDREFFSANVVLYVVNCSGGEIENHFEGHTLHGSPIKYLTYAWEDVEGERIFSPRGNTLHDLFKFADEAECLGVSCLIHSKLGKSRSICAVCGYLMLRYGWSAKKTLEFLIARIPDLTLRRSFIKQILKIETQISKNLGITMSSSWDEDLSLLSSEELLLRNTFKNSFSFPPAVTAPAKIASTTSAKKAGVKWKDCDEEASSPPSSNTTDPLSNKPVTSILKTRTSRVERRRRHHHRSLSPPSRRSMTNAPTQNFSNDTPITGQLKPLENLRSEPKPRPCRWSSLGDADRKRTASKGADERASTAIEQIQAKFRNDIQSPFRLSLPPAQSKQAILPSPVSLDRRRCQEQASIWKETGPPLRTSWSRDEATSRRGVPSGRFSVQRVDSTKRLWKTSETPGVLRPAAPRLQPFKSPPLDAAAQSLSAMPAIR